MTELKGCVAQSQIAHETTCLRGTFSCCRSRPRDAIIPVLAVGGGTGTDVEAAASSPVGSVMADTLLPTSERTVSRRFATRTQPTCDAFLHLSASSLHCISAKPALNQSCGRIRQPPGVRSSPDRPKRSG